MKDWTYFQAMAALQDSCFLWNALVRYHLAKKKKLQPELLNGCSCYDRKFSGLRCFSVMLVTIILEHGNPKNINCEIYWRIATYKSVDGQTDFRVWVFEGSCKSGFEKSPLFYVFFYLGGPRIYPDVGMLTLRNCNHKLRCHTGFPMSKAEAF